METPSFDSIENECKYWKEEAQKWKEKYEKVKKLYALSVSENTERVSIKRALLPLLKVEVPEKKPKIKSLQLDPFTGLLDVNIVQKILAFLDKKDFLKMTEVSKTWKDFIEYNHLLSGLNLKIDLSAPVTEKAKSDEILQSNRVYKQMRMVYDFNSRDNCFRILSKLANSLEQMSIFEKAPQRTLLPKYLNFQNLRVLKFDTYISDEMCQFLNKSVMDNLKILHIKRRGYSEALMNFICACPSLSLLNIVGDDNFFKGFERYDERIEDETLFMEFELDSLCLQNDDNSVLPLHLFLTQNSLKSLTIIGLKESTSVALALKFFENLRELTLSFNIPILCDDDIEYDDDLDEIFDEILVPNLSIKKLTLNNIEGVPEAFMANLFLAVPNLLVLIYGSTITKEYLDFSFANLPNIESISFQMSNGVQKRFVRSKKIQSAKTEKLEL